jgi:hypothetical protein
MVSHIWDDFIVFVITPRSPGSFTAPATASDACDVADVATIRRQDRGITSLLSTQPQTPPGHGATSVLPGSVCIFSFL